MLVLMHASLTAALDGTKREQIKKDDFWSQAPAAGTAGLQWVETLAQTHTAAAQSQQRQRSKQLRSSWRRSCGRMAAT